MRVSTTPVSAALLNGITRNTIMTLAQKAGIKLLEPIMKVEVVTPEEFKAYEAIARAKGFLMVSSSPLTRSSHHAGDDFARLKAAREAQLRR